ncbi:PREDICTED: uncharacterized protein LOC104734362 [Camelina sativa]|uniref:Uncharacterized protein LOC104734362 n=1 Tax=Camelina sativa TaxID=90675 RepID=A0ABM0V7Q9_CAMSA|nr:PREDICTED: uncharacterized protein LOC104734362 [Camelina sativa]
MYQMLGRVFKLSSSARIRGLCLRRQVHEQRLFSTSATPYLLLRNNNAVISPNERLVSIDLFDPRKQETVKIPEQRVSKEVQESVTIGSSRGWVGLKNIHDSSVRLTNIFNPSSSSPKVVSLPPLGVDISRAKVSSLSLSASPDDEGGDCVVAVSFFSPMLGLCRPGESEWTYIKIPQAMPISKVMYSVTDKQFYISTESSPAETGLITSSPKFPPVSPYPRLLTHQSSELLNLSTELMDLSCYATPYLVETPSGESLIVFWVRESFDREKLRDKTTRNTKSFIVFRRDQEELKTGSFTRDIGNLCIFLGKNEAFCVSATDYPGLQPNSVYFGDFDTGFGFYALASLTLHDLTDSAPESIHYMWLAPLQ